MTDKEQLAYIAGLVDGEGSICIHRDASNKKRYVKYNLLVNVSNTDPRPLRLIQGLFGGSFFLTNRTVSREGKLPCWGINVSGPKAENLLRKILPYLIIKKEQAVLALEFRKYQTWGGGAKGTKSERKLRCLKKQSFKKDLTEIKRPTYLM